MMVLIKNNKGFTLIEILVALVIDFVVLAGIYAAFYSQQKSHVKEQQVVDAQQNVRGSAAFMTREIRLAGMDRQTTAVAGILAAEPHSIQFTLDRNEDDDVADEYENIAYGFAAGVDILAPYGIADDGAAGPIIRFSDTDDTIADNIYAIAFAYAFDDDRDGELDFVDAAPFNGQLDPGEEIWAYDSPDVAAVGLDTNNADSTVLPATIPFDRIRAVRIWILARTRNPLREAAKTKNFVVGDKIIPLTDNYQYRLLTATVKCRNLGI
jgi:prepilin-type N-terminal cleavage/methylation domain-containing protein